jgi:toxin ParE1/3/4
MKPLVIDAEAEAELVEAIAWYQKRRQDLGLELHDEVLATLNRIRQSPGRGWKHGDDGHRVMKVNRFPYLVFYDESDEDIWVAAIAHERRRPDYWRNRKPE